MLVVQKAVDKEEIWNVKEWWIKDGGVLWVVTETGTIAFAHHAWVDAREERS